MAPNANTPPCGLKFEFFNGLLGVSAGWSSRPTSRPNASSNGAVARPLAMPRYEVRGRGEGG